MRNNKTALLDYGLKKGYFTTDEHKWCMDGKNIKDKINSDMLEKVNLAQPIFDKIILHPGLAYVQAREGDSRWNQHIVADTFNEIISVYGANCYNNIMCNQNIPEKVKTFFHETFNHYIPNGGLLFHS